MTQAENKQAFAVSPLSEQWQWFVMKEHFGMDWSAHKKCVEDDFAWKSNTLLRLIKGHQRSLRQ